MFGFPIYHWLHQSPGTHMFLDWKNNSEYSFGCLQSTGSDRTYLPGLNRPNQAQPPPLRGSSTAMNQDLDSSLCELLRGLDLYLRRCLWFTLLDYHYPLIVDWVIPSYSIQRGFGYWRWGFSLLVCWVWLSSFYWEGLLCLRRLWMLWAQTSPVESRSACWAFWASRGFRWGYLLLNWSRFAETS